jgi:BirA family biotin operon repressor/biotin-[acetyl-CoA-carboxylase] ligase
LFPAQVANAVSLKQITGKTYNVVDLAKELCSFIEIRWQQLKVKSPVWLDEYSSRLYRLGEKVSLKREIPFSWHR